MTTMTPQQVSERCIELINKAICPTGIVATVPAKLKLNRDVLYWNINKYYELVLRSDKPFKVTIPDNGGYTLILGQIFKLKSFSYRQQFITLTLLPTVEPIDLALVVVGK